MINNNKFLLRSRYIEKFYKIGVFILCLKMGFPRSFLWGISMAAFQYEMGISRESIDQNSDWYVWLHDKRNLESGAVSGDLPEDGPGYWDLYKEDHRRGEWLGLNAWRTSVEWSRIFPNPTFDVKVAVLEEEGNIIDVDIPEEILHELDKRANKEAVNHYSKIFKDLKNRGMKLILNIYHWPLPLWIHDPIKVRDSKLREGPKGWVDGRTVIEFAKFAAYVSWKFGEYIDMWSTMNEPNVVWRAYRGTGFPPNIRSMHGCEKAAKHLMEAHARAYDQIKRVLGKRTRVGVIYAVVPAEPIDESEENLYASWRANYEHTLWFFNAIIKGEHDNLGLGKNVQSRDDLKERADWIGINYYSRIVVEAEENGGYKILRNYGFRCKPGKNSRDGRPVSDIGWEAYPEGIVEAIQLLEKYNRPMAITENGVADKRDRIRPWLLVSTIHHLERKLKKGRNIFGYFHWSLLDNLEWYKGFRMRFGLFHVDMKSKKRTPRPSAYLYRDIIELNGIPEYLSEYIKYPNFLS